MNGPPPTTCQLDHSRRQRELDFRTRPEGAPQRWVLLRFVSRVRRRLWREGVAAHVGEGVGRLC